MQYPQTIVAKFGAWGKQQAVPTGEQPDEAGERRLCPDGDRRRRTAAAAIDAATNRPLGTIDNIETTTSGASAWSRAFDISDPTTAGDTFAAQIDRFAEAIHSRGNGAVSGELMV